MGGITMKQAWFKAVIAVVTFGLLAAACGSSSKSSSSSTTVSGSGSATSSVGSATSTGSTSSAGNTASATGITPTQITVGLDTSLTGPAAANFNGAVQGVTARFDQQNAEGGVNGRTLKLTVGDDRSGPGGPDVGVVAHSAGSVRSHLHLGLGVVGLPHRSAGCRPGGGCAHRRPRVGTKPNTNMVSVQGRPEWHPGHLHLPSKAAQLVGAKNMAALAIANEQPSIVGAQSFVNAAKSLGLDVGYKNYSIPIGSVDATATVLAMKQAKVDGFMSYMLNTTDFAIMESAKQAGIKLVAPMDFTSYTQDLLDNARALAAAQGASSTSPRSRSRRTRRRPRPSRRRSKSMRTSVAVPNLSWTYGWLSADLFIKGMQAAGQNPTRASFLDALHNTQGWTANGLLARSPDLSLKDFGTAPATACAYFVQLHGSTYTPLNQGQPICGNKVG